jgi:thioredoxin 1|nr:thioredoxin [uncultured Flavobacterium sp.]
MMSKFNELINGDKPVLVDFYATWCSPCKLLAPNLVAAKEELGDGVIILKIDVDANQDVAAVYQVRSIPTLILFKNGKVLWRQSGVVAADEIVAIIRQNS